MADVQAFKRPVGALELTASATSQKYCSGTFIARALFLTAGHCVDRKSVGHYVAYERVAGGTTLLTQSHYRIAALVEDGGKRADFAILRLDGNPGDTLGWATVATADPANSTAITIISHPDGKPKMVEAGAVSGSDKDRIYYGDLDTLGANSGSGILDRGGVLVGLHTNGGCTASGGANSGARITKIRGVSSIL